MHNKISKVTLVFVLASVLTLLVSVTLAWAAGESRAEFDARYHNELAFPDGSVRARPQQQASNLKINNIVGATYNPATGEIIVIGQMLNEDLPEMDYDYVKDNLVVAMRAVHEAAYPSNLGPAIGPAVTIDPVPNDPNADHNVRFFGSITHTHYGYVFFEADRLLKTYVLGRDNLNINDPFASSVPGYRSFFDRWLDLNDTDNSSSSRRWWFTPTLHLRSDPINAQTIVFSNTKVNLNWELMSGTPSVKMVSAINAFRDHFQSNYSQFASEQRDQFNNNALYELPQLYKLYGIAHWTWSNTNAALNINGVNSGWLDNYSISNSNTPLTTPAISRTGLINDGGVIYTVVINGGVGTNPPQSSTNDSFAQLTGEKLLQDRPSPNDFVWTFNTEGDISPTDIDTLATIQMVAMAFPLSDNLIENHSFEGGPGSSPWVQNPGGAWDLIDGGIKHWGDYAAYLGNFSDADENIYQEVTIPTSATNFRLSYYWAMLSDELQALSASDLQTDETPYSPYITIKSPEAISAIPSPKHLPSSSESLSSSDISVAAANDFLYVQILDVNNNVLQTLHTISNENIRGYWQVSSFSLDAYKGQTIRIKFRATNNASNHTAFFIDDVSLDIDPLNITTNNNTVFLPIIMKPAITQLYVQNNVGKTINLTIHGIGSNSIPPTGTPEFWGAFPSGTYNWTVTASGFAPETGTRTFFPGVDIGWGFGVSSSATSINFDSETTRDQVIYLEID